jgi:hypothetical protein
METWYPLSLYSSRYEVSDYNRVRRARGKQVLAQREGGKVFVSDGNRGGDAMIVPVAELLAQAKAGAEDIDPEVLRNRVQTGKAAKARRTPPDYVAKIKGAFAAGWTRMQISEKYGVEYQVVCNIIAGRCWFDVPAETVGAPVERAPGPDAWRKVPGFPRYVVTRDGRIKVRISSWGTELQGAVDPDGVKRVWLTCGRGKWHATVDEVVAAAWGEGRGPVVAIGSGSEVAPVETGR